MSQETDARIIIDRLLREAGWEIEDKAQVSTEEAAADGRADYLLKDSRSRPLAVLEAKRFSIDPYAAKDQARAYAQSLPVHFVLLSNGHDHYFWDCADGDARPILGMPTQADLERRANLKLHRKGNVVQSLAAIPYPKQFRFRGEDICPHPYQLDCLRAADAALAAGQRRMLLEMATGTGKTLTIAMLIKRWFQAGLISRVLFLVGKPTFGYEIQRGISEKYLANYEIYLAESRLTFEGAQWGGDEIAPGDWERTYTSQDRNKLIVDEFYRVEAERVTDHPRKTILFAHPKAAAGFTLASRDEGIRQFWIEHCIASRKIGEYFGRGLGSPCITNIWIPDGIKDTPADRKTPRLLLKQSLDTIFAEKIDRRWNLDAVEGKLFGIGSESYVVGSHEFYLGFAITHKVLLTLDTGHYHPTEIVSDKLSSVLAFVDEVLLHVSRGVRWDSDHVVILSDELQAIAQEVVRAEYLNRVHIGLDYFDASINRIAAWVIGARNVQRALLIALVEPTAQLRMLETNGDYAGRLALLEEMKGMPFGAVWDCFCLQKDAPVGLRHVDEIRDYARREFGKRT